jgi:phosphoglycerate dehydrogenase-like enzyme
MFLAVTAMCATKETPPVSTGDPRSPLGAIVMTLRAPAAALARLRREFPGVRFVAAEERPAEEFFSAWAPAADDLAQADALIGWELDAGTLAAAPRLRWLHAASAGVEHFDLAALAARGIVMTNSRGVHAPNIAEHVLGMMLALTRRVPTLARAQAERRWRDTETHREVGELLGQTLLLVGLGAIGRAVAVRAAAFGMRIHGVRRDATAERPAAVERVFDIAALHDALAEADHVVVTLPDTPRSRGLIDAAAFAAMKPGAVLYNVGRGPVVDTGALVAALQAGRLGGAGLDVTDPEPLPADSPLWDMENVLITAHTSGATPRYWERQEPLIADNIRRWQTGQSLRNVVDLERGY